MEEKNSEKKERKMRDSGIPWIGEVPEKWKVMKIGHCFRLKNEKNFLPENKVQLLSLYTGIGVFPTNSEKAKTSGNHAQTVNGYKIVHKNDIVVNIILAWMGSIGVSDYDGVVSPAYDVYTPDLSKVIPRYAHYVFRTDGIAGECLKYGRGIMMMRWRTYSPEFKQIKIPFPSAEKQKEIADILLKVVNIIENRKQELKKFDTLVKARFVELFGNPVYNTNDLPIRSLNELGNWASGGTPSRTVPEYFEGNIDWYSAGELNTLFLEGSVEKITEEAIEKSATKLFKAGSLLIGMYDTAAFKMGILKEDSASNQACACITPNDEVNIIWLYYELQMMKEYFLSQRRGVRQKNLNLGMIKAFKIPIAKRDQQDEFSDFVKQVDKSKVKVQKALDETQKLFDSLMQQYFG